MQKKIWWVYFFHQVDKISNYFQSYNARMIFSKMTLNLGKIRRNLRKNLRFDFFLFRLIFNGGFLSQKWTGTSFDKECGAFSFAFGVELDYRC